MSIALTASYVADNESTYASKHGFMLKALDELVYARYNGCSWLAFRSNLEPQLPTGDVFTFGTITNLQSIGTAIAYNSANETVNSASLTITAYNTSSNVAFVSDFPTKTLNRKTITWQAPIESGSSTYYLGIDGIPERFESLQTADILIQNYVDPIYADTSHFSYRSHWDKYGAVRIHNGNRFPLEINIQSQTVVLHAYGIVTARRTHQTGSFTIDTSYFPITKPGDRMSYQGNETGQIAGCMDGAYNVFGNSTWLRYNSALPDYDSTSEEKNSFVGHLPTSADYYYDWLIHTGSFISVITDKNTSECYRELLTWNGLSTGFATNNAVTLTYNPTSIRLTSRADSQLGHSNFEHDIIPLSCNMNGSVIFSIKYGKTFEVPATSYWTHLQQPLPYGSVISSSNTIYTPFGIEYSYPIFEFSQRSLLPAMFGTLGSVFPSINYGSSIYETSDTFLKTNGAIGRHVEIAFNNQWHNYGDFSANLLVNNAVSGSTIKWNCVTSKGKSSERQRFISYARRKYQTENGMIDIYGNAFFLFHPQDGETSGSLDGSGSFAAMTGRDIHRTDIQIEDTDYQLADSALGMEVYLPRTNLYYVLDNIYNSSWWVANRSIVFGGITEQQKLISWRLPRLTEHLNDLVKAINNVVEVYPVTIKDLYKDPLPNGSETFPYSFGNEPSFAIPSSWIAGRYDTNNTLKNWCTTWGISYQTTLPNINTLESIDRYLWAERQVDYALDFGHSAEFAEWKKLYALNYSTAYGNTVPLYDSLGRVVNTYPQYKAWYYTHQRKLFGGAGSKNGYVYVNEADAQSVFFSMSINLPTRLAGERYTPSYSEDGALSKLTGDSFASYDDGLPPHYREVMDAFIFYKKPEAGGSYIQTVRDAEAFRLISTGLTVSNRRKYQSQLKLGTGITYQWLVHEYPETVDTIAAHNRSTEYLAPQASENLIPTSPKTDNPAYKTLTEIYSDVPVLLVCGPEPYFTHQYDAMDYSPSISPGIPIPETYNTNNPVGSMFVKEVSVSDMPITSDKIQSWSGQTWPVWHCQIVRRTGTLRS